MLGHKGVAVRLREACSQSSDSLHLLEPPEMQHTHHCAGCISAGPVPSRAVTCWGKVGLSPIHTKVLVT